MTGLQPVNAVQTLVSIEHQRDSLALVGLPGGVGIAGLRPGDRYECTFPNFDSDELSTLLVQVVQGSSRDLSPFGFGDINKEFQKFTGNLAQGGSIIRLDVPDHE